MSLAKKYDPEAARRFYNEALEFGRVGNWTEAGLAMARAWCAAPDQPRNAHATMKAASMLAYDRKLAPAASPESDNDTSSERLSFVVCSIEPARLNRLKADIESRFANDPCELIHIPDARSLSEGYTRGLQQARGDLIVFCHDDIGLINVDFAARLRRQLSRFDFIGLAGTDLLRGPSWHWTGPMHTATRVCTPHGDGVVGILLGCHVDAMPNAQAFDGVFLAGKREVFEKVPFDAETFDGFHFYDVDQSYRAFRAGYRCAVALDLLIWHQSGGNFGETWRKYAERFLAKFPELEPQAPSAGFNPGTLVIRSPQVAPAIYAWVDHWLRQI